MYIIVCVIMCVGWDKVGHFTENIFFVETLTKYHKLSHFIDEKKFYM